MKVWIKVIQSLNTTTADEAKDPITVRPGRYVAWEGPYMYTIWIDGRKVKLNRKSGFVHFKGEWISPKERARQEDARKAEATKYVF